MVACAVEDFTDLTGQAAERVSGIRRTEDGWSLLVDDVDIERVPATTSVLSTSRVDVDGDGNLLGTNASAASHARRRLDAEG